MNFVKKQTAGSIVTFITLIMTIVSLVVYQININSEGYFQNGIARNSFAFTVWTIVLLVVVLALAQINVSGIMEKVVSIVTDLIRIVIPVLVIVAFMALLSSRIEGFAFIYFSNEEVLHEVQTAANLSSAQGAIANLVLLAITAVCGMVAAFFNMKKKEV